MAESARMRDCAVYWFGYYQPTISGQSFNNTGIDMQAEMANKTITAFLTMNGTQDLNISNIQGNLNIFSPQSFLYTYTYFRFSHPHNCKEANGLYWLDGEMLQANRPVISQLYFGSDDGATAWYHYANFQDLTVGPPDDSELCTQRWAGSIASPGSWSFPNSTHPITPQNVQNDLQNALNAITNINQMTYSLVHDVSLDLTSPNQLDYIYFVDVMYDEVQYPPSVLYGATATTLNYHLDGPFMPSSLSFDLTQTCYVPYASKCSQVSAKLESGEPFASVNGSFYQLLTEGLLKSFTNVSVDLQSYATSPPDFPDTIQVAFRTSYQVKQVNAATADADLGYALTVALGQTVAFEEEAPLFEVNYTVTPCHLVGR